MIPLLALSEGAIFAVGTVIFIAVFTAALGLGYARFAELGESDRAASDLESTEFRNAR